MIESVANRVTSQCMILQLKEGRRTIATLVLNKTTMKLIPPMIVIIPQFTAYE